MKIELYLTKNPGSLLEDGAEVIFAGQFETNEPPTKNLQLEDEGLLRNIFREFNEQPPEQYRARSLSIGDVVTIYEKGFARSYTFGANGPCRLTNAITGGQHLVNDLKRFPSLRDHELTKLTTSEIDHTVTIVLFRNQLAPEMSREL